MVGRSIWARSPSPPTSREESAKRKRVVCVSINCQGSFLTSQSTSSSGSSSSSSLEVGTWEEKKVKVPKEKKEKEENTEFGPQPVPQSETKQEGVSESVGELDDCFLHSDCVADRCLSYQQTIQDNPKVEGRNSIRYFCRPIS